MDALAAYILLQHEVTSILVNCQFYLPKGWCNFSVTGKIALYVSVKWLSILMSHSNNIWRNVILFAKRFDVQIVTVLWDTTTSFSLWCANWKQNLWWRKAQNLMLNARHINILKIIKLVSNSLSFIHAFLSRDEKGMKRTTKVERGQGEPNPSHEWFHWNGYWRKEFFMGWGSLLELVLLFEDFRIMFYSLKSPKDFKEEVKLSMLEDLKGKEIVEWWRKSHH